MGNRCNCCERRLVLNGITTVEKGERTQKVILEVVSEELIPGTKYCLDSNDMYMPAEGKALPAFLKVREGKLFGQRVSIREVDDCDCDEKFENEHDEDCDCGCGHKHRKPIPISKSCLGNVAFGADFIDHCGNRDKIRKHNMIFVNNDGGITLLKRREFDED